MQKGKEIPSLYFSSKITLTLPFDIESVIMKKLSNVVENDKFPNFSIMYASLKCKCNGICDKRVNNKLFGLETSILGSRNGPLEKYTVLISELAKCDLSKLLHDTTLKISQSEFESLIMQLFFATFKFHTLNYEHCDLHLGNILIHEIEKGGFWHYKINKLDVYVPNLGLFLVLWDFGACKEIDRKQCTTSLCKKQVTSDYIRWLDDLLELNDDILPNTIAVFIESIRTHILEYKSTPFNEREMVQSVFQKITLKACLKERPSNVINKNAYTM